MLISFAVTAKLICAFVFAYADCWFSHAAAHIVKKTEVKSNTLLLNIFRDVLYQCLDFYAPFCCCITFEIFQAKLEFADHE